MHVKKKEMKSKFGARVLFVRSAHGAYRLLLLFPSHCLQQKGPFRFRILKTKKKKEEEDKETGGGGGGGGVFRGRGADRYGHAARTLGGFRMHEMLSRRENEYNRKEAEVVR